MLYTVQSSYHSYAMTLKNRFMDSLSGILARFENVFYVTRTLIATGIYIYISCKILWSGRGGWGDDAQGKYMGLGKKNK